MQRSLSARLTRWIAQKHWGNFIIDDHYALLEACLIGCISAIAALLLKNGIAAVGLFRLELVESFPKLYGRWPLVLPIFSFCICWCAGWIVETFAPDAKGGGIPQVKAALAQFPVLLSLRVAVVKLLATILVLGAGLTLGRRGPTVHIGAALAAQLSQWVPTSPQHRRQMIAAGAAAGLAAGFNTPIAGVLFVVEELSRDMSGLTLETAILASFTGSVVSRLLGSADLNLPEALLNPGLVNHFTAAEIPFYLLLGGVAGVLGVVFNQGILACMGVNQRLQWPMAWQIGAVGLISGTAIALAPPTFLNNAGLRDFLIAGDVSWDKTLLIFTIHFVLTVLAYGSGASGGLFSPALVLGSALGYLIGELEFMMLHVGSPTTYALVGMGAFFTAVARVPITAIVIVFELTTDFHLVLPLMISAVMAYGVAEGIKSGSIYQHLLKANGIDLKDETGRNDVLTDMGAGDVMQRNVETLTETMTVQDVYDLFGQSFHHGFPVVDEGGEVVGMITEQHLAELSNLLPDQLVREVMTMRPVTIAPQIPVGDVMYLMDRYQVSHLPVTEGRKLLGIITRSDLIHATADHLRGKADGTEVQAHPSYSVYQTRSPASGKGRILLPIANPHTAPCLVQIAAAIATTDGFELECLVIITVPRHTAPAQARVDTQPQRELLDQVEAIAQQFPISVHCQIRIAQDTSQAILETIRDRHIDRLIMGWKGSTDTPGRIFGTAIDTLIKRAPCEVMLIKPGKNPDAYPATLPTKPAQWMIPMSGGPNVKRALHYLPALTRLVVPGDILLTQVFPPAKTKLRFQPLKRMAATLSQELECPVIPLPMRSQDVADAIVKLTRIEACSLVILGASREGMLQQAIHGNIPEAIAAQVNATVILLRAAVTE